MNCALTEEELWSGLDRHDFELEQHVADCPECRQRAAAWKTGIRVITESAQPATPPLPPRIGSYRIIKRLGQGGMGIVYEGEQSAPKRAVAVKVVRGGQYVDEYKVRLFQREAQTLARLRHPAIAAIYEAGRTEDGQHFFAMELVQGLPLNEFVESNHVTLRVRLELFSRICDAINYAHQRGVIHRDLKPTNIIVDAEGNPKVLDFGLARITDPDNAATITGTEIGRVMGTLAYMSPEEARGSIDEIDVRSDVYSLGVIFFELLTEELPYSVSRAALHEAVRTICEESPKKPRSLRHSLNPDLETIALKALEKNRARRYQSAAAFVEDVQRFLSDQPIHARRASMGYQLRKWALRHKIVCAFFAGILGITSGAWYWVQRAEEQLRAATRTLEDTAELRVATTALDAAKAYHESGNLDKAVGYYRDAQTAFQRLGRNEARNTGEALLGLALALSDRTSSTLDDLVDAERFVAEAATIFQMGGVEWQTKHQRAIRLLERIRQQAASIIARIQPKTDGRRDEDTAGNSDADESNVHDRPIDKD